SALLIPADCASAGRLLDMLSAWTAWAQAATGLRIRLIRHSPETSALSPLPACGERVSRTGGPRRVRGKHIWFAGTTAPHPDAAPQRPPSPPASGERRTRACFHFRERRPKLPQRCREKSPCSKSRA